MIEIKRILLASIVLTGVGCSKNETVDLIEDTDITVIATELDSGSWQIDYHFPEPQTALIFGRSNGDYRTATWVPEHDAPEIERVAGFDAIFFTAPTQYFSYEITPHTTKIPRDYTPFLAFSDGGRALHTGQFELLKVDDRSAIEALNGDLVNWRGRQPNVGLRVRSTRPMVLQGETKRDVVEYSAVGSGTYIYIGDAELFERDRYLGVIDAALPDHVRSSLDADLSALFEIYDARWGFELPSRATIYYAFEGFDRPGYSNAGSVIGTDLMVLQSSGEALREPDPDNRIRNLWFFAHEAAHMYQSKLMRQFTVGPDAWIHEGGANTMANSAIQALPGVPSTFIVEEYKTAFASCVSDLQRGTLETAHLDGRFYAHYHCGQIFNAAADAALPDHDLYAFWAAFTDRLTEDAYAPATAFFETLEALGADPAVGSAIRALAYEASEDPRAALADLMTLSGLAPEFDASGQLVTLEVPS